MEQTYRSQILDHLGLVAGMVDELGIGDVIDKATQQNPEMRDLTVGEAIKAMVLNGLGFINQALYLVPRFFQNKPTSRLIAPRVAPEQRNDDARGRALDTLYDYGVTELYSLIAATAAKRLGLAPTFAHLDRTSFHVDGRYNREEDPDAEVIHITRGYSQDHRPDLNQVLLELIVEHQAGIPVLMQPLSGNSRDAHEFGQMVKDHIGQLQTTYGTTYLVADSALYTADNLQKLAETQIKWMTRVPATVSDAQAALTQAAPQTMAPLTAGYRYHGLTSTYGGVAQRWVLVFSKQRHAQAQRTVDKQLLKQGQGEGAAFQKLGRMTCACEADAQQALATFTQGLQTTCLQEVAVRATPCYRTRGRPSQGVHACPDHLHYRRGARLLHRCPTAPC
jgi:transposase